MTPLENGFSRVQIAPQPVALAWAAGAVPTPHGAIQVGWEQTDETFQLTLNAPTACALHIVLPCRAQQIIINGQKAMTQGEPGNTIDGLTLQEPRDDQLTLVGERGGTYEIHVVKG